MPRCTVCKELLPPIITERTEDGKTYICAFCKRDQKDEI
jgi:hypothetical protein